MHKRDMMDFIGALKKAHHAQTALYFDESRIQGYTDQEIAQIAKQFYINITGQFYELMHPLGRCSGGLFGAMASVCMAVPATQQSVSTQRNIMII